MKKILLLLLALALMSASLTALAEGDETVTLEVNTAKLPLYAADDAALAGFRTGEAQADGLPVLLIPVKRPLQLQVSVLPATLKNRKSVLSADNEEILRVKDKAVTGLKAGEAVLTIASEQDPSVTAQYRVVVYQPVSRISLTASGPVFAAGQTVSVTPAFQPEDATLKEVTWSSSDEKILTVDENGTVTGVKRGFARVVATAKDGSGVRGAVSLQVTQNAAEITLDKAEMTVNVGTYEGLRATVLPKDTNDKNVVWSSSDESIATVNTQGRVKGIKPGECEITCASKVMGDVKAKAVIHVQQPVKRIVFGDVPVIYINETGKLGWTVEPADATNPAVTLSSAKEGILTISSDGTITGIAPGKTQVIALSTDGSNRRGKVDVKVFQHLESVRMRRDVAYIDRGEVANAGVIFKPEKNVNGEMTWESSDPSIATAKPMKGYPDKVKIAGVSRGETVVTGTSVDGGLQTSIHVKVGDYSHAASIKKVSVGKKGQILLNVRNVSRGLALSNIKVEIEAFGSDGKPAPINKKDKSNRVTAVYSRRLSPGNATSEEKWKFQDFNAKAKYSTLKVRIVQYQINGDWVKMLRKSVQETYTYKTGK